MAMASFRFEFFSYCRPQLRALQRVHVTAVGLWFASDLTFSVCAAACVGFVSWLLDYKSMLAPAIDLFVFFWSFHTTQNTKFGRVMHVWNANCRDRSGRYKVPTLGRTHRFVNDQV